MAKGQMRSNREPKKPKKQKVVTASVSSSPFSKPQAPIKTAQYVKRDK